MKKIILSILLMMAIVSLTSAVYAKCDGKCNGKCTTKIIHPDTPFREEVLCSTSEDPDCPNPALARCCGNNICDKDEDNTNCPSDCAVEAIRNVGSQAYGAIAECSSSYPDEEYQCKRANDGSERTYWASFARPAIPPAAQQWIKITLDKARAIDRIILKNRGDYRIAIAGNLNFEDGSTIPINLASGWDIQEIKFNAKLTSWVKLNITQAGENPGLREFEIYEVSNPDTSKVACRALNYEWLDYAPETDNGSNNYCCGNNPERDLGNIIRLQDFSNYSSLCYYDNKTNKWQWLQGNIKSYQFKIYTIEKPNATYDVACNGRFWQECTPAKYNTQLDYGTSGSENSYRFICYNETGKSSFAECCPPTSTCFTPNKARYLGEPTTLIDNMSHDFIFYKKAESSGLIGGNDYKNIPLKEIIAEPTKTFEFFVKFSKDADFKLILAKQSCTYIGECAILFEKPLKDYIVNPIVQNKWLHVIVPLNQIIPSVPYAALYISFSQLIIFANATQLTENVSLNITDIFLKSADTRYCGKDVQAPWILDLDSNTAIEACDAVPAYGWTGTRCCGDDQLNSTFETYSDSKAGCWKGLPVENNSKATDRIVYLNGVFYGCNITEEDRKSYWNMSLISKTCEVKGDFFCNYDNKWSDEFSGTKASERNTSKALPESTKYEACCAANYCWNGTTCIAPHTLTTEFVTIAGKNWRCVAGEWRPSLWKWDWDSSKQAICDYPQQCLVDADGNAENNNKPEMYSGANAHSKNPQCINHTQFIEDHYCDNGTWTSRTKLLAIQLLNLTTQQDFILYCDHYTNILNDYDGIEKFLRGPGVLDITCHKDKAYPMPCVNNICILRQSGDKKPIIALSLNRPPDFQIDGQDFMQNIFSKRRDYCSNVKPTDKFTKCSGDSTLWYSGNLNAIIYSRDSVTITPTFIDKIVNWFKAIISSITGKRLPAAIGAGPSLEFANKTKDYNKIYIAKSGNKEIYAIQEIINKTGFIAIFYKNFTTNLCPTLETYMKNTVPPKPMECNYTPQNTTIITSTEFASHYWQQLTSALRFEPWQLK